MDAVAKARTWVLSAYHFRHAGQVAGRQGKDCRCFVRNALVAHAEVMGQWSPTGRRNDPACSGLDAREDARPLQDGGRQDSEMRSAYLTVRLTAIKAHGRPSVYVRGRFREMKLIQRESLPVPGDVDSDPSKRAFTPFIRPKKAHIHPSPLPHPQPPTTRKPRFPNARKA